MSRRNECLINSYQDAKEWLEEFRDTITDDQVLKVIEQLETEEREDLEQTADQLSTLQDKYDELFTHNKDVEAELKELKVSIVQMISDMQSMLV